MNAELLTTLGGPGSGFHDHAGRPGYVGGSADSDRATNLLRIKDLGKQIQAFGQATPDLTAKEARRYEALVSEYHALRFDVATPSKVSDVVSKEERQSTLDAEVVVAARADLLRNRVAYTAITKAAAGSWFDADTPVDDIMNGRNPEISADTFSALFENTRRALRRQYGDTITLYRATGSQREKATSNWATTEAFARQFGPRVIRRDVSWRDIIAVNTGLDKKGRYHEVIVGRAVRALANFNPSQARNKDGEWTKQGQGDTSLASPRIILGLGDTLVDQAAYSQYLLKYGREWTGADLPPDVRLGPPRQCFTNTSNLVLRRSDLDYVEGVAYPPSAKGLGVLHAWAVTKDGIVIDPTWKDAKQSRYFGVRYTAKEYLAYIIKTGVHGVFGGSPVAALKVLEKGHL